MSYCEVEDSKFAGRLVIQRVVDTKLSRETKGGTVLQLSFGHSDLLGRAQGLTCRNGST